MPHYADGTEAKVGDQVHGHLANTPGEVAGVIVSITPGSEACNAMVQFALVQRYEDGPGSPRMAVSFSTEDDGLGPRGGSRKTFSRGVKPLNHGSDGDTNIVFTCCDYADVNKLTKVG